MKETGHMSGISNGIGTSNAALKMNAKKGCPNGGFYTEIPLKNSGKPLLKKNKGEKAELKKSVGLFSGTALIVGTMIGSGVFISPKGVLEGTGSVGFSLIIWTACGLVATLGALSYAELGTAILRSGGEHAYLMYVFGSRRSTLGSAPAFLFAWVGLFVIRPTMFAVMTLSLGTYAVKPFFPECDHPPDVPVKFVTIVSMLLLAFINSTSVKWATYLQNVTTVIKLIAICVISVGGIYKLAVGPTNYMKEGFKGTKEDPSLIAIAFYNGLWAFDGWNNLNFVTEELKNPEKNLPRCILIGIPVTTVAYVLANVGYFAVMSKEEILASHAVAVTWGEQMLGVMSWIIPVFVVLSCLGSANGSMFSTGRLCFAAAREGHFPTILSYIQMKRLTPVTSVMFTCLIAILIIIPGDLSTLIDFYSFSIWLFYGATTFAVIVLRFTEPKLSRPYKVPIFIPVAVLLMSIYLTVVPIVQTGRIQFFYAFLFLCSGLLFYFPFVCWRCKLPFVDTVTEFLQKLLLVVPPKRE